MEKDEVQVRERKKEIKMCFFLAEPQKSNQNNKTLLIISLSLSISILSTIK
jgi:hypothetical protein